MKMKLKDAIEICRIRADAQDRAIERTLNTYKNRRVVSTEDEHAMVRLALKGLNVSEINAAMGRRFHPETVRRHLALYKDKTGFFIPSKIHAVVDIYNKGRVFA